MCSNHIAATKEKARILSGLSFFLHILLPLPVALQWDLQTFGGDAAGGIAGEACSLHACMNIMVADLLPDFASEKELPKQEGSALRILYSGILDRDKILWYKKPDKQNARSMGKMGTRSKIIGRNGNEGGGAS